VITGAHLLLFSPDADADRAFVRDVLGFAHVDAGHGWLIFKLPPAELAVHPAEAPAGELYLLVDDVEQEVARLSGQGVPVTPVREERWGRIVQVTMPSGATVGVYEPNHPLATALAD
jgi:catechol 2,3-dioxygenase-like lactoylglutathione lyase family enzyme